MDNNGFYCRNCADSEKEIQRLRADLMRFAHRHKAGKDHLDTCASCGLDIRHDIHLRQALNPEVGDDSAN